MTIDEMLQRALQHHHKGELAQAEPLYRQILQQQPNHPAALCLLGRLEESVAAANEAIRFRPQYPEALNNLGNSLLQLGRSGEAVDAYRRSIALNPAFADAHNNLGNALTALGRQDEALFAYQEA